MEELKNVNYLILQQSTISLWIIATEASFFLIHPDQLGCQTGDGKDYKGKASVTKFGRTCQKWSSQKPHGHRFADQGDNNYCRNPDGESGPWCYTTEPGKRWELCVVPKCAKLPRAGEAHSYHTHTWVSLSSHLRELFCGGMDWMGKLFKDLWWRRSEA